MSLLMQACYLVSYLISTQRIKRGWRITRSLVGQRKAGGFAREIQMSYSLEAYKQRCHVLILDKKLPFKTRQERRKGKVSSTYEEIQGVEMGRRLLAHSIPAEDHYHFHYADVYGSAHFYTDPTPLNVEHGSCGFIIL